MRVAAAARWRRLVRARLAEIEAFAPDHDLGAGFWDRRAEAYAAAVAGSAGRDPFLARVRRRVGPRTTVVDVGAGSGRFTIALARRARQVIAVDQSRAMLDIIARQARADGHDNVVTRLGRWPDLADVGGDVVLCSYVIPLVADIVPFVRALDAAARRAVFVSMNAVSADLVTEHLWRHFHGRRRHPAPTYLDAAAVLDELGLRPQMEVAEAPLISRWDDLDAAVESYRELLLLDDRPATVAELVRVLDSWLVERGGVLRPPLTTAPIAVLSWTARSTP